MSESPNLIRLLLPSRLEVKKSGFGSNLKHYQSSQFNDEINVQLRQRRKVNILVIALFITVLNMSEFIAVPKSSLRSIWLVIWEKFFKYLIILEKHLNYIASRWNTFNNGYFVRTCFKKIVFNHLTDKNYRCVYIMFSRESLYLKALLYVFKALVLSQKQRWGQEENPSPFSIRVFVSYHHQ